MKTITNCYVYIVSDGEVYYSYNESCLTLDISKAAFFKTEGFAKSRKNQVARRICFGLKCIETEEIIKTSTVVDYKVTTYQIEEPIKDFMLTVENETK